MLRKVTNYRFNPFTAATAFSTITSEPHLIPASGTYWVRLNEVPDETYVHATSGTPLYVVDYSGNTFTQTLSTPGLGQFRADYTYKTGWVEFNSGNADTPIKISYRGTGSPVEAELINSLQRFEPATAVFCGDGSDGEISIAADTSWSESPSGSGIVLKQPANISISSGFTLSIAAGVRGMILAVAGRLKMDGGVISVVGRGGAGGTGAGDNGSSGGFGGGGGGTTVGFTSGGDGGGVVNNGITALFCPGAGKGGSGQVYGGAAAEAGQNLVLSGDGSYWRSLVNQMVYGAGGGAGNNADDGGAGGGFIIINCNILEVTSASRIGAYGGAGAGSQGGGGSGGTVVIIANHIKGYSASDIQTTNVEVYGGAATTYGAAGAAGYKKVVEMYEHNVY
jgi:hypothetical protein